MVYAGVDNGVTGSIGIIKVRENSVKVDNYLTPVKKELDYTKKKQYISRIDTKELLAILGPVVEEAGPSNVILGLERPMVNPRRYKATNSALRALEATLIVIELLAIPFHFIDSKEWQRALFPKGVKGTDELKRASCQVAKRLYGYVTVDFPKAKDFDGLLIAHYLRLNGH